MIYSLFKRLSLVSLFLLSSISLLATDYYLSPNGNDSNAGTSISTAWKTLSKINTTTFVAGDRLLLESNGVWTGQMWAKGSGVAGNPIVIDQYGTGNKPVINGAGTNYPSTLVTGAVMLYNQSYWEINNLEVTNYHASLVNARAGILVINASPTIQEHIYVRNCYVHDVNSDPSSSTTKLTGGIIFFGSNIDMNGTNTNVNSGFNDVIIEKNKVYNVTKEGIRNKSDNNGAFPRINSNIIIRNNHIEKVFGDGIVLAEIFKGGLIEHNFVKNVAITNSANYAGVWTHYSTGSIIQFNEVCDMTGGLNDGEAFDADNNCDGDIFQYNYSHNNTGGFFLIMPSAQRIIIRYNISQNDGNGKELFHYTSNTYTTNNIYNNTFYIGAGRSTTLFRDGNSTRTVRFYNNIIQVDGSIVKFADNPLSSNSYFANNCFYPSSIANTNGPSSHPGLVTSKPMLVDPSDETQTISQVNGFKLQSTSPLINAGVNLNNNGGRDFINTSLYVSGKADIGAIEYEIPSTETPTNSSSSLKPTDDAYVRNGTYAIQNFGQEGTLTIKKDPVGYEREVYLKFDLSSLTKMPTLGKLQLYVESNDETVSLTTWKIYFVSNDDWTENGITWNNKPSSESTELASVAGTVAGNFVNFDIFNQVLNEYNHDKIISLRIISTVDGSKTTASFASKENIFSDFSPLLITEDSTLPVQLISFIATQKNQQVNLKWATASETNLSHFTISRSTDDGINFIEIGKVQASGKANNYSFIDFSSFANQIYYQLIATDFDDKTQKSSVVVVKEERPDFNFKIASQIGSEITLVTSSPKVQKAQIFLTDLSGKAAYRQVIKLQEGQNILYLNSSKKGVLIVTLITDSHKKSINFLKN